jgi:hypothetical protein
MEKGRYYVFVDGGKIPTMGHYLYNDAVIEAQRLVEKEQKAAHVVLCQHTETPKISQLALPCDICGCVSVHDDYLSKPHLNNRTLFRCNCGDFIIYFPREDAIKRWNWLMEKRRKTATT